MTKKNKIYFYIRNTLKGIPENSAYFIYFKQIISPIQFSTVLIPNETNIIIDNLFSHDLSAISSIKKNYPKTKLIFLATEFNDFNDYLHNNFNPKSKLKMFINHIINALIPTIFAIYRLKFILYKNKSQVKIFKSYQELQNYNFEPKETKENKNKKIFAFSRIWYIKKILFGILAVFTPYILIIAKNKFKPIVINQKLKFLVFLRPKLRFINMLYALRFFDLIIRSHPAILFKSTMVNKMMDLPIILDFNNNKKNKNFSFSGIFTKYRYDRFNSLINHSKISKNNFEFLNNNRVNSYIINDDDEAAYSFYPKKDRFWKYSSPMSLIMSINKGSVPIIMDQFPEDKFVNRCWVNILNINEKDKFSYLIKNRKTLQKNLKRNIEINNSIEKIKLKKLRHELL